MILKADAVSAGFDEKYPAFAGVGFELDAGESLAVCGPSGSGKSTLLYVLAGLLRPFAGAVHLSGVDVYGLSDRARSRQRRDQTGFVFQFGEMLPELDTRENVALPLLLSGESRSAAFRTADEALTRFGLSGYGSRDIRSLSGGEVQRAAIARALVHRPVLVLADEPTGALDEENSRMILAALLEACADRGVVVVIATHDPIVASATQRVAYLKDGAFVGALPLDAAS